MAGNKTLSVGVIGAGLMGGIHIKGIADIARRKLLPIRLAGFAELNRTKGLRLAKQMGCRYFNDGAVLIQDPEIDVVVIAIPTAGHLPLTRLVVESGKPLFLEKPLGRNLAEAREIAALLKKSKLPHQIGLILRFAPTYNVLKELLDDPKNGEFVCCRFRDDQNFPVGGTYGSTWRADAEQAGGGTLIEHSIHDIDVMNWFFGEPKVTDSVMLPSHASGIEKLAMMQLKFKRGGVGQLSSVWHGNATRENERHIEIFYQNRYFQTDGGYTSPIIVQGPRGVEKTIGKEEIENRFRKMIRWTDKTNGDFPSTAAFEMYVFLKALTQGEIPRAVPVEIGIAAHEVIDAAYRKAGARGRA